MITIVAVGKRHEDWVQVGVERYEKRLKQPFSVRWILLPHSSLEGTAARQEESERIGKKLNDEDYVILLDERGVQITSDQLSHDLQNLFAWGRRVVLVIGGAYGVTDELQLTLFFRCQNLYFPTSLSGWSSLSSFTAPNRSPLVENTTMLS